MSMERLGGGRHDSIPRNEGERLEYKLESGNTIELVCKRFHAEMPTESDRAVVFLPGWGLKSTDVATREIAQGFADAGKGDALSLTTRWQERGQCDEHEGLYEEARAVARYIKEHGLKDVTIAGHSQGGDKAINLVTLLQEDPDVRINGLVLIDSVGLYEQSPVKLAVNFAADGIRDTAGFKTQMRAASEVLGNEGKEAVRSGASFVARFTDEVKEMARQNPRTSEVQVPVVIISGMGDLLSSPHEIVPNEVERRVVPESDDGERDITLRSREAVLKENLFPRSPYVRMLAPERAGSHILPFHRPDAVAKTSLYMLDRYERTHK